MIELKDIGKSYGSLTVYKHFNLALQEGVTTCLLGPSGCGKTTLLNIVAGLIPHEGEAPELTCSYIFQTPRLLPNLTVKKNLRLVCGDDGKIFAMLARLGMEGKADRYPCNLSGGERQRVSIARAFLYPSDVILMDEPFSSLDLKLKINTARLFSEINAQEKRTAVFVTHDVDEAIMLADRIVILKNGGVCADVAADGPREYGSNEPLRKFLIGKLLA